MEDRSEHTADPPGTGVDVIHPVFPKDRQSRVWPYHTVEQREHDEEERQDIRNDRKAWCECRDPLAPARLDAKRQYNVFYRASKGFHNSRRSAEFARAIEL